MAYEQLAGMGTHEPEASGGERGSSPGGARALAERLRSGLSADALRYHFLAERLREAVFHLDQTGRITFLGPSWTALSGAPVEVALGRPLVEWVHPEDRPRLQTLLDALTARVQASFRLELRLMALEGPQWVEVAAHSSPTGQGEVMGTLADATAHHQLQAYLLRSHRMTTLGMLVPGFTHEMNNPLAFMAANLDYLVSSMDKVPGGGASAQQVSEWREAAQEVLEGAERLRQLIGHLRSLRNEPGQGPVEVNQLLDSVGHMISGALRSRGRLVRDYGAPFLVAGGENGLRQALVNLVFHAVLSLPEDGDSELNEVRLVTREDGQGNVLVEVHDTGPGIPPERLPHVFEPLFATSDAQPRPELSVCRDIVRGLGGDITVSSTLGRGTVFRVTLPALS